MEALKISTAYFRLIMDQEGYLLLIHLISEVCDIFTSNMITLKNLKKDLGSSFNKLYLIIFAYCEKMILKSIKYDPPLKVVYLYLSFSLSSVYINVNHYFSVKQDRRTSWGE